MHGISWTTIAKLYRKPSGRNGRNGPLNLVGYMTTKLLGWTVIVRVMMRIVRGADDYSSLRYLETGDEIHDRKVMVGGVLHFGEKQDLDYKVPL